jgi:predicted DNA-binding transcriptional regulator YafY
MRRTERLFAMTELLRSRRSGITAEAIAERFGITVRTVYRDLDALRAASLPLHSDRGPGGGYALDRSYSLPPVNFTAREAAVLVALGAFATEMRALPFVETLGTALDKVRAALPRPVARELEKKLSELSFVGIPQVPVSDEVRRAVERAWFDGSPLHVTYTNAHGETSARRVVIKKVLMDRRETRLFVHDLEVDAERELLLHRIGEATLGRPPPSR